MVERTIFYAFSGGQESDAGTIGGRVVQNARMEGEDIVYTLSAGHGLHPGDPVRVNIDWNRRYRLMRLHLAAEILLELVQRTLDSIRKVGAHIGESKARIDFHWPDSLAPLTDSMQKRANALIRSNQDIISAYSDEAGRKRYWEITGFARVPCGGTHLHTTGEIGEIKLKRRNPGKGTERIEITLSELR